MEAGATMANGLLVVAFEGEAPGALIFTDILVQLYNTGVPQNDPVTL